MNKSIGYILTGVLSAAAGAGVTYIGLRRKFENELNDRAEQIRKDYEKSENELSDAFTEALTKDIYEETEETSDKPVDSVKDELSSIDKAIGRKEANEIIQKNNYAGYFKKEDKKEKEVDEMGPYIISEEEFDESAYSKVTLTYFMADEVFTDIDDTVVDDGMDLIGRDNVENYGVIDEEADDSRIFICNEKVGTVYEVFMEIGAFYE